MSHRRTCRPALTAGVTALLLAALAAGPLSSQAPDHAATGGAEIWIAIGPQMRDRMVANKAARVSELEAEAMRKVELLDRMENGPCRCGAPSHAACETPDVCEVIEQKQMDAVKAQIDQVTREAMELLSFREELAGPADPGKILAARRATALRKEVEHLQDIRQKMETELGKVLARSPEGLRLHLSGADALTVVSSAIDQTIVLLPPEQKQRAMDLNIAVQALVEAFRTGDEVKIMEAVTRSGLLARGQLARYVQQSIDAEEASKPAPAWAQKKWLGRLSSLKSTLAVLNISARIYDLGVECIAASTEWNQEHDREKLKVRRSNILEKATDVVGAIPNVYCQGGALAFGTAYRVVSFGTLGWHMMGAAIAAKRNLDLSIRAESVLRHKISSLNSQVDYKERMLQRYERFATTD